MRLIDVSVAIELSLELVCILVSISGGLEAAQQKHILMRNCWETKEKMLFCFESHLQLLSSYLVSHTFKVALGTLPAVELWNVFYACDVILET